MSEVQLHGNHLSPFSFRVEIDLKLNGIEYDFIEEDPNNKSNLLVKYNPVYKKIPVMVHKGKPLLESLLIVEYIEETWDSGTPLLPKHPYHRAQARFWAKFIDDKLLGVVRKLMFGRVEEREELRDEVEELLKHVDDEIKGKKFFGGESIGLVDIAASTIGYWVEVIQEAAGVEAFMTRQKFPHLYQWIDTFFECSIIKQNLPPRHQLLAYYQSRIPQK